MTTLIIVRHGNTFNKDEIPRRIGAKTDIPLVSSGVEQARCIGKYFQQKNINPNVVYCSPLLRTQQTANIVLENIDSNAPIIPLDIFKEIDYGPDENRTEKDVIARIGSESIKLWNEHAIVPKGWNVNPETIINNWEIFAQQQTQKYPTGIILVITSNGIARFSPYLTGNFTSFSQKHSIKISTGAFCLFKYVHNLWTIIDWNLRPQSITPS